MAKRVEWAERAERWEGPSARFLTAPDVIHSAGRIVNHDQVSDRRSRNSQSSPKLAMRSTRPHDVKP
jgi:hypothetical protein